MVGRFLIYDVTFQKLKIKIRWDFLMIGDAYQDRVAILVFSLSVDFSIFVVRFFR